MGQMIVNRLYIRSHLLYSYSCGRCKSAYIGKSKRHFFVRVNEHLGISLKTGKEFTFNVKNKNNSTILSHINQNHECKLNSTFENFNIIGNASTDGYLCIKESLLIQKLSPNLNQSIQSTPLKLFDWPFSRRYSTILPFIFIFILFFLVILLFQLDILIILLYCTIFR